MVTEVKLLQFVNNALAAVTAFNDAGNVIVFNILQALKAFVKVAKIVILDGIVTDVNNEQLEKALDNVVKEFCTPGVQFKFFKLPQL
jgi:hypothetical protein